jgi:hypothetical protein
VEDGGDLTVAWAVPAAPAPVCKQHDTARLTLGITNAGGEADARPGDDGGFAEHDS